MFFLLHAECHPLNCCSTPLCGTLAPLITCSSGDPVLGMLLVIRVLHNSHARYPAFRFPPSSTLYLLSTFLSSFLFFVWFVVLGELILCSMLFTWNAGLELCLFFFIKYFCGHSKDSWHFKQM